MDVESAAQPGLPLYALLPALFLVLLLAGLQARRAASPSAVFVILALTLRVMLDALHAYTFGLSPLKLSWNALASTAVCGLGLFFIRRKPGLALLVLPILPLLVTMLASGAMNHDSTHAFTAITKVFYYLVLAIMVYQAADEIGGPRFVQLLLPVAMLPLLFQLLAIPLGVTKAGESDGSVSYVGGFHHEAAFSLLLLNALLVICFADRLRFNAKAVLILWCGAGLFLANYRTTMLASGPLLVATMLLGSTQTFVRGQRLFIGALLIGVALLALTGVGVLESDRFADLGTVWNRGLGLIQPPRDFSFEDRHLLSGRAEIWSEYIYAWRDGTPWQHVLGFGPESWNDTFGLYPHNSLVSALYETGLFGVCTVILLWLSSLSIALRASRAVRLRLIAAHLSFIVVNQATMPFWMIEGVLYYAILCGLTAHYVLQARRPARSGAMPLPGVNLGVGLIVLAGRPRPPSATS